MALPCAVCDLCCTSYIQNHQILLFYFFFLSFSGALRRRHRHSKIDYYILPWAPKQTTRFKMPLHCGSRSFFKKPAASCRVVLSLLLEDAMSYLSCSKYARHDRIQDKSTPQFLVSRSLSLSLLPLGMEGVLIHCGCGAKVSIDTIYWHIILNFPWYTT